MPSRNHAINSPHQKPPCPHTDTGLAARVPGEPLPKDSLLKDLLFLAGIEIFLVVYFDLRYLLYDTVVTGGDTASWHGVADHLLNVLLPQWRLTGWDMGNFGGYPNFSFYFLPPFLAAVLPAALAGLPLTITLKWAIMSGVFLLPLTTYAGLRAMGHRFPFPVIGAAATLLLIFNESYTMFGGNALSTFAGEFCYMFALAVLAYFIGAFYRGVHTGTRAVSNGLLLGLLGLSHLFVFIPALIVLVYGFFQKRRSAYVFTVGAVAFSVMAFWILPLIAYRNPYTTPVYMIWERFTHLNYTGMGLSIFAALAGPAVSLVSIKLTLKHPLVNHRAGNGRSPRHRALNIGPRAWFGMVLFSGMGMAATLYAAGRYVVMGRGFWQTGLTIPDPALSPLGPVYAGYLNPWVLPLSLAGGIVVGLIGIAARRRGKPSFVCFCRSTGAACFLGSVITFFLYFHCLVVGEITDTGRQTLLLSKLIIAAIYLPPAIGLGYGLFFSRRFGLAVIRASRHINLKRTGMWLFLISGCVTAYFGAHFLQVPDIRFLPPMLFALIMLCFTETPGIFMTRQPAVIRVGVAVTVFFFIFITVIFDATQSDDWYRYNNRGYAYTYGHADFKALHQHLRRYGHKRWSDPLNAPRVAYEKCDLYAPYGGDRAFESMSYFSGRQTLEGIHYASSLASRSVAFLQSEFSRDIKTPAPLILSRINPRVLPAHLDLYNISHLVVASEPMKQALSKTPKFEREADFGELALFRYTGCKAAYVEVPKAPLQLHTGKDWPTAFYSWFKEYDGAGGLLVADRFVRDEMDRATLSKAPDAIATGEWKPAGMPVRTQLTHLKIKFTTTAPGRPHLVKVSYFPNWRVKGAHGIYPVSPHFMLVIPREHEVVLTYGRSGWEILGFLIGIICLAGCMIGYLATRPASIWGNTRAGRTMRSLTGWYVNRIAPPLNQAGISLEAEIEKHRSLIGGVLVICCLAVIISGAALRNRPVRTLIKGHAWYARGMEAARQHHIPLSKAHFKKAVKTMMPLIKDRTNHDHLDIINAILMTARCYENLERFTEAETWYRTILAEYPYSRYVGEAHVKMARNFWRQGHASWRRANAGMEDGSALSGTDDLRDALRLWARGIHHFKQALDLDPYSVWAERAARELSEHRFLQATPAWTKLFKSHPWVKQRLAELRAKARAYPIPGTPPSIK